MPTTMTLTDRYVDAAMRTVPEKQRADLSAELRASIRDQIDARVENGEPHDAAEHTVLTDLGDPEKLAAGYTDRPLHLIGPAYYLDWWRLLKLLWAIVLPFSALGVALAQTLAGEPFGSIVGSVVTVVLSVAVHLAFWVTLIFFIIERSAGRAKAPVTAWSLDHLPEPRESGAGLGDLIASLVFLAIGVGLVLWDQQIGFVVGYPDLPFLNPELWPWWIVGLFALMTIEAITAVIVYAKGRWTYSLAIVNTILNVAITLPALWLLSQGRLINPEFFPTIVPDNGAEVGVIVGTVLGFVFAAIAVWDSIDGFLKARRAS